MQYKKAKLMIVDQHPNDKITTKLLTKVLRELNIPIDKLYITSYNKSSNDQNNTDLLNHEIEEINPKVVLCLGKYVLDKILLTVKRQKISNLVGMKVNFGSRILIACYSCHYVVNHGQKELQDMKDCFTLARKIIFDEVH